MSAALTFDDTIQMQWGTSYSAFLAEAWPLLRQHWQEVGTFRGVLRLNPDHERYRTAERQGALHILTARCEGVLVGYTFLLILPHPRDKDAILARDDIFYTQPKFRRFGLGPKMIDAVMDYVQGRADIVMLGTKARRTLARGPRGGTYLARWGMEPLETTWGKVLRRPHGDVA